MKKSIYFYIVLAIAFLLIGYGLGTQKQGGIKEGGEVKNGAVVKEQAETKEPIKIGLSVPLTGETASLGEGCLAGAQLAVKEINDTDGINGNPIKLIVEDDQCNPNDGVTAYSKLINIDNVIGIVGPLCSSAAGASVPIAQSAGTPVLLIASAPLLTSIGDYIFRVYPSDSLQGKFAAEYIYKTLGKIKAAVVYVQNDWGQGLRNVFIEQFKTFGGEIVYEEGVAQDTTDLKTVITKVKAANPNVIYYPMYPAGGVAGLKEIKELGLNVPIVGGDAIVGEDVLSTPEAEGLLYTAAKTRNPQEFQNRVAQVSTGNINLYTSFFYDAVKILAQAIEKAGTDKAAVKEILAKTHYQAISTPIIEFEQNGDLKEAEFEVRVITGGKSVLYQK